MDDIQGKQQRDARRAFLYGDFLQLVEAFCIIQPKHRTRPACADLVFGLGPGGEICPTGLVELPDLFCEAHPPQERLNLFGHFSFRWNGGGRPCFFYLIHKNLLLGFRIQRY